ncbi:MAG: hypothetical protein M3493_07535 [Actinomycetota bacterium]|jgi:hypothetical protein|nr:hypothetical protein [Actinomycetota bacterium]
MTGVPTEEGLNVVDVDDEVDSDDRDRPATEWSGGGPDDLESLRDEFVEGFNARDLDALLALAHPEIDCPDRAGDGAALFADELQSIWERSPGAILTRAFLDETPCAVAWLPDEDGCWSRAAMVCLDAEDGVLTLLELPDDADALDRAEAEDPTGEDVEEGSDWAEWDSGAETVAKPRHRDRP